MSRQPYVRPMPKRTWFLRNGRYKVYMLREMTCLLVGFYSFLMIWGLAALARGTPEAWNDFLASQQNGLMIAVHAVALVYFFFYQTFAWFKLAPKVMPLQLGERKLPENYVIIAHYAAWIVLSAFILWAVGVF